jgi:GNAT superfamily N-acetyltransferase
MQITRLEPADDDGVRVCHSTTIAARAADDPVAEPQSLAAFGGWLRVGYGGTPSETWYVPASAAPDGSGPLDGAMAGFFRLELPDLENTDRGFLSLIVHPAARRHGVGSALLRHALARAAASGRSLLATVVVVGSTGETFVNRLGAEPGIVDVRRILHVRSVPTGHFARLRAEAAERADGYSLVRWTGQVPEERLELVAAALNAMNDAPREEGWFEDDLWDADRVRDRGNAWLRATGTQCYSVAAVHDVTGEMAGLTQLYADAAHPTWAHQGNTSVTKAHRGHRLGLLIKASLMEWLAAAEPALEQVSTDNAAPNSFMIAVNEALGYRPAPPNRQFYQLPVSGAGLA